MKKLKHIKDMTTDITENRKKLIKPYFDHIITEHDFEGVNISEYLAYQFSKAKDKSNIALLIEKLPFDSIFPSLLSTTLKKKNINITVIEYTHYSRSLHKIQRPKLSPLLLQDLEDYAFEIYFPLDYKNFSTILAHQHNAYIIIDENTLPEELETDKDSGPITVTFDNNKDEEDPALVFTLGNSYIPIGQALNTITSKDFELIICNNLKEIQERILHTNTIHTNANNIIIAVDHYNASIIKKTILHFLYDKKIFDKQVCVLTPWYTNLTTFLEEYSEEESGFNADILGAKILTFLTKE